MGNIRHTDTEQRKKNKKKHKTAGQRGHEKQIRINNSIYIYQSNNQGFVKMALVTIEINENFSYHDL